MIALVRGVAASFAQAITMEALAAPIMLDLAQQQHKQYVDRLKYLLDQVVELPADDKFPDCVFIEDTAVVVPNTKTAVVARIGAAARQGEEPPVAAQLRRLGYDLKHLQLPGTSSILVGVSKRTNAEAVQQIQQHLPSHQVLGIPVSHGLHLKSALTALDGSTLLFADDAAGRALSHELKQQPDMRTADGGSWQHVLVPDAICANVLLIGQHVVMQSGYPESERLLEQLCDAKRLKLHKLPAMTEFIKADAALTEWMGSMMASHHSDQIKAHALSIVCGRALKHSRDVRSICSMLQTSKSVNTAIVSNASRNLALQVTLFDEPTATFRDMAGAMWLAHWVSKYRELVGELEVSLPESQTPDIYCASLEALVAAVMPRLQLRHLIITGYETCMLLAQVNPVHLTSLDVQRQCPSRALWPVPANLSRLSNLQQLSIGSTAIFNDVSYPAGCFAGLPTRLTQLVVAFKLPAEAYAELPCQLRRLMLTGYDGSSITHLQQLSALALCDPEGPGQALAAAVNSLTGLRHLTLGLSGFLQGQAYELDLLTAMCAVPPLRDLRLDIDSYPRDLMATIAKLTNLTCLVWGSYFTGITTQSFLQMLQLLTQLEKLCFGNLDGRDIESFGDLFSKHLTKLQSLHVVVPERLLEPLFSQVLAAASGLTSLTLGYLESPDRDLGMIACSAPRLRELTLLLNYMDEEDLRMGVPVETAGEAMTCTATTATLSSPYMPHLQRLTLCGSLALSVDEQGYLNSLARIRPHLHLQCHPNDTRGPLDYLGCVVRQDSATVKIWD
eukprot:gene5417-5650_t